MQQDDTTSSPRLEALIADLCSIDDNEGFGDVDKAVAAIDALEKEAEPAWLPRLHTLLVAPGNFFVREGVAPAVIRLEGVKSLPLLIEAQRLGRQEHHDNDSLDAYIIQLLEKHPQESVEFVRPWLSHPSPAFRDSGVWLLSFMARASLLDEVMPLANDRDGNVRVTALCALPSFPWRNDVLEVLVAACNDPSEDVRTAAVRALCALRDPRADSELQRIHSSAPRRVREQIQNMLDEQSRHDAPSRRDDSLARMIALLTGPDEDSQVRAAGYLGYLGDSRALPELKRQRTAASERLCYFLDGAIERIEARRDNS